MSRELPLIASVGFFYYVSHLLDAAMHPWKLLRPCAQAEGKPVLSLQGYKAPAVGVPLPVPWVQPNPQAGAFL